jgi:transposase
MIIIGCDFHPSWQQVAWLDTETGETGERRLVHAAGEAEPFYRRWPAPALIGMESTGNCHWLLDRLTELGHEVWMGDAAQIRATMVRQQKTDRRDAAHLLGLLVEGRFPRIWVPASEERDQRQLLIHRHKLVTLRTRVKNELQHLALNQGVQKKRKLWSVAGQQLLRELPLRPWASRRREDLLKVLSMLAEQIQPLEEAVKKAADKSEMARLLMTQPGVGPVTSLAFMLTIGDVKRFARSKQVASYLGLIPREYSSGGRQRLGSISKQGVSCACCWWKPRRQPCATILVFANSICIAVMTRPKEWPKWQRRASWPYDCTGCCAPKHRIRKSFTTRAARGWPWSAEARPLS